MEAEGEAQAMLDDPEMRELAEEELARVKDGIAQVGTAFAIWPFCRKTPPMRAPRSSKSDPARGARKPRLFAGDLLRMYQRYAETKAGNST